MKEVRSSVAQVSWHENKLLPFQLRIHGGVLIVAVGVFTVTCANRPSEYIYWRILHRPCVSCDERVDLVPLVYL